MANERRRKGFTIIEVSLVLAISGLLLIGIISSTNGSISRQRYNDSVQSVTDQLRSFYSKANNPQGLTDSGGRGNDAFYGKLVIFGDTESSDNSSIINSYTIIGNADAVAARGDSAKATDLVDANLSLLGGELDGLAVEQNIAPWGAAIEVACKNNTCSNDRFSGSLLILYSAYGGVVHTYYTEETNPSKFNTGTDSMIRQATSRQIDLCINSPDIYAAGGIRRNIRIAEDGRNSSAVQLIDVNSEDNQCTLH